VMGLLEELADARSYHLAGPHLVRGGQVTVDSKYPWTSGEPQLGGRRGQYSPRGVT
jgi:hypothetical protein